MTNRVKMGGFIWLETESGTDVTARYTLRDQNGCLLIFLIFCYRNNLYMCIFMKIAYNISA